MMKVSPSGVGMMLECPRCLWLQVNDGVKRPRGIFPSLPDGMDNVFKKYFDGYRSRGELPPEVDGRVDGTLFTDLRQLNSWRDFNFGRGGISATIPEYDMVLSGAIDDLVVAPDGRYVPFDFKTRGYPLKDDTHEHYRTQLDLYGLLFERNNMPIAGYGYLLFFWPASYDMGSAQFKTELVRMDVSPSRGLATLERVHKIATGEKPIANAACEYCAYRGEK